MAGNLLPPGDQSAPLVHESQTLTPAPAPDYDLTPFQPPAEGGGIPWRRYLSALRRYKWLMLLVIVLGTGGSVLATRFMKPEYTVQATIWIESPQPHGGPVRADAVVEGANWVELLTTYTVLDSVVARERLYLSFDDPKDSVLFTNFKLKERFRPGSYVLQTDKSGRTFNLKSAEGLAVQQGKIGEPVGSRIGFDWTPAPNRLTKTKGRKIAFDVSSPRDASLALRAQLTARLQNDGNFLRLELLGTDPVRLTSTMNALINHYVDVAAELKRRNLAQVSSILAQQLDTVGRELREAEGRLEGFKVQTITQPGEGTVLAPGTEQTTGTVVSHYFQQKMEAENLKRDREALQTVLARAKAGDLAIDAYQTIPSVRGAPDLQGSLKELSQAEADLRTLQYRYTDEYQPVQLLKQRIKEIREQSVPAYTNALIAAITQQESDLRQLVATSSKELQQMPARSIFEQRYKREVESIASIYNDLQQRYESAKLAEASAIPDVRILDPAVLPERPSSNSAARLILMGFMASTGLALALAIVLDQLDKRFRYPEQVTDDLGLAIFGAIPAIRNLKSGKEDVEEAAHVVEAFRAIRLNLLHSYGSGPVLLTVSSPGPGDGKSLVSSNLALSFAEAGYKAVLVDGDIRRGELHRMFKTERIPGLIDYLMKQVTLDQVLRPTTHPNLTLLPCGTRRHSGPELLGTSTMTELIGALKSRFGVVIVDSPPLGAGIDPFVLGTVTGNIVLVLRSGETNRQMAEAKIKLLDRLPVRVLGAVLNDIRTTEAQYQYYSYVYGYTSDEEAPKLVEGPKGEVG